jgi:predicted DCC family thiol-disulfide oxidoreductase YuxK
MDRPVIVFDGVCNLCNASVDFVLKRDRREQFLFASNQSEAGRELLQGRGVAPPDDAPSVYLVEEDGRVSTRSTAALRIARRLRFPWWMAYAFIVAPRPLRDAVYDFIARNRYRWFGKSDTCRLPTAQERARFLDAAPSHGKAGG